MPLPSTSYNPLAPPVREFLLAEDGALKARLSGMTVSDGVTSTRAVPVFFTHPDPEIREQTYPYVTVEMIFADEDKPRTMSGYGVLPFLPYGMDPETSTFGYSPTTGTQVLPMIVTYQVSSWARQPRHDRSIAAQLMVDRLHPRFAVLDVPDDNSGRRLEVEFNGKRDSVEMNKPLYRNVWTVRVPAEIFFGPLTLTRRTDSVIINTKSISGSPPA